MTVEYISTVHRPLLNKFPIFDEEVAHSRACFNWPSGGLLDDVSPVVLVGVLDVVGPVSFVEPSDGDVVGLDLWMDSEIVAGSDVSSSGSSVSPVLSHQGVSVLSFSSVVSSPSGVFLLVEVSGMVSVDVTLPSGLVLLAEGPWVTGVVLCCFHHGLSPVLFVVDIQNHGVPRLVFVTVPSDDVFAGGSGVFSGSFGDVSSSVVVDVDGIFVRSLIAFRMAQTLGNGPSFEAQEPSVSSWSRSKATAQSVFTLP